MPAVDGRRAQSRGERAAGMDSNHLAEIAVLLQWTYRTLRELPQSLRFPSEILRQLSAMIRSSTLVIWIQAATTGILVAQYGNFTLKTIGAQAYVGLLGSLATLKGVFPVFIGFIVAAKIGCGFVAEIGAMRINDEVDALDVIGLPARQYLVGTRVWAAVIAFPLLYLTSAGVAFAACQLAVVDMFQTVSAGGYLDVYWAVLPAVDLYVWSFIWTFTPCLLGIIVACYYGFHARGGPVGVGEATAKSMQVNVILITVLGAGVMFQLFYGTSFVLPIVN